MKMTKMIAIVAAITAVVAMSTGALAKERNIGGGNFPTAVVYVVSQGLFYDSIVLGDLPMRGRFQLLEMTGPTGLQTEFGPGDHGYVGGRWWVDVNGDSTMDADDMFFLCPLLGPGRTVP